MEGNRPLLWQENRNNFIAGAYGNPEDSASQLIYWQNMENAHYPWARENVERLEAQIAQQMQAMQQKIAEQQKDIANHEGYEQYLMDEINKGGAVNVNNNVADANAV